MCSRQDTDVRQPLVDSEEVKAQGLSCRANDRSVRLRRCKSAPSGDWGHFKLGKQCYTSIISFGMLGHPTRRAVIVLLIYLGTGILCFLNIKDDLHGKKTVSVVDALYFCVVTMTTVGYGDLVPATTLAKLMTCLFVFVGFGVVGLVLGNAAHYLVEKQEHLLERAMNYQQSSGLSASATKLEDSKTQRVHYKVAVAGAIVSLLFVAGMVVLVKVEGLAVVDAFYCICVTVTTLGYGDYSFKTTGGRLFGIFWILVSTVCVAQLILNIVELVTEGRQRELAKRILSRRVTSSDIEAADMDADGAVSLSEFIVYKLKEMGKVEEEDLAAITRQFRELDVDQSGTITLSDVNAAQLQFSRYYQ